MTESKKKKLNRFISADKIVLRVSIAKGNIYLMVRVRIELTTLALSAPRSADWANGPALVWEEEFLV